jgi:hypothetical protein
MFRSRDIAYWKPSSFNSKSCILGREKGFHFMKLDMTWTIPSFFGIINVGYPRSDQFIFLRTPILYRRSSSIFRVASCTLDIGHRRAWYGLYCIGVECYIITFLFLISKSVIKQWLKLVNRCLHCTTTSFMFAFSYLAFKICFIPSVSFTTWLDFLILLQQKISFDCSDW